MIRTVKYLLQWTLFLCSQAVGGMGCDVATRKYSVVCYDASPPLSYYFFPENSSSYLNIFGISMISIAHFIVLCLSVRPSAVLIRYETGVIQCYLLKFRGYSRTEYGTKFQTAYILKSAMFTKSVEI